MKELIERLERATEGSRGLDARVGIAANGKMLRHPNVRGSWIWPHYTTSIDAALTLVPEGWGAKITIPKGRSGAASVFDPSNGEEWGQNGLLQDRAGNRPDLIEFSRTFKHAATPALALCIAALKAREAENA